MCLGANTRAPALGKGKKKFLLLSEQARRQEAWLQSVSLIWGLDVLRVRENRFICVNVGEASFDWRVLELGHLCDGGARVSTKEF